MKNVYKYCINCEHCKRHAFKVGLWCVRPIKTINLVHGGEDVLGGLCEKERNNVHGCGRAGRYYKAKRSCFENIKEKIFNFFS